MFLALKELKHGKFRFTMIGLIIVLIAWLVFILSGLGNGLSTLSAATIKNWEAEHVVYEEGAGANSQNHCYPNRCKVKLKLSQV